MNRKNELLARVYIVMTFFVLFTVWVMIKVVHINVIEGDKWREKLTQNIKWREVEGERGSIFADDGSLLAASQPFFEIRFDLLTPDDKTFKEGVDSLAFYISRDLRPEKSPIGWKNELVRARNEGKKGIRQGARYYLISSKVEYNQLLKIREYPVFRKGRFGGGLIEVQKSRRVKPFNEMASRTIGMDRVNAEKIGLEGYFDDYLKGQSTKRLYKRLPNKVWIPVYQQDNQLLNKGADLITTINVGIQDAVHQAVLNKLHETRAQAGVGIVMDVKTGAIKAMTSLSRGPAGAYGEFYNYAMGWKGKYNPGSTFKLATVMALLENGHATPETLVDLQNGQKMFGDKWMSDSEPHQLRWVSMEQAFVRSSNVGIASLADRFYNRNNETRKQFIRTLKSFGLSEKTGITISGESDPLIKDPVLNKKEWSGITIPWMAHGYELELTPLQLLTFYNAVANEGKLVKPMLVKEVILDGNVVKSFENQEPGRQIASDYTLSKVRDMLEKVVQEGTAQNLRGRAVKIAGKTGTTRINYNADEREAKVYTASFAGYFPADEPRYSCIVVMYGVTGFGNIYGSQSAAPVFGDIAEKIMRFESMENQTQENGIVYAHTSLPSGFKGYREDVSTVLDFSSVPYTKMDKNWVEIENKGQEMVMEKLSISRKTVPDVRGMGVRDAIYVLENLGLEVRIEGVGRVKRQSLAPHTKNNKGQISLYLE